jgi:hypothetical protein
MDEISGGSAQSAQDGWIPDTEITPDDTDRVRAADRAKAVDDLIALAQDGAFAALLEPCAEKQMWD